MARRAGRRRRKDGGSRGQGRGWFVLGHAARLQALQPLIGLGRCQSRPRPDRRTFSSFSARLPGYDGWTKLQVQNKTASMDVTACLAYTSTSCAMREARDVIASCK